MNKVGCRSRRIWQKTKGHLQQSAAADGSVQVSKASAIRNKKEQAQRPEDGLTRQQKETGKQKSKNLKEKHVNS